MHILVHQIRFSAHWSISFQNFCSTCSTIF
nr:MAG TPA: Thioredoxin [Caudoviricetes sp.]